MAVLLHIWGDWKFVAKAYMVKYGQTLQEEWMNSALYTDMLVFSESEVLFSAHLHVQYSDVQERVLWRQLQSFPLLYMKSEE